MNNILYLLPNEHLRSFLSRVHTMSPFGTFATSAKRVGLANFSASPVTVMSDLDAILMNILNDDNRSIWQMHMHGNVIESFLNEREKRELPLFLKGKPYDIDFTQSQTVHNRFWRYCKDCISEDLDTVGISYFHQQHQLQGVFHCYKHRTRLINSSPSCTYTVKNLSRMQTPALICPSSGSSMTSQGAYYDETMLKVEQLMLALNDQTLTLCLESVQQNTLAHIGFTLEQTETLAFKKACGDWYKEIFVTLGKDALEQYFSNTRKVNDHIISPTMRTTRLFLSTSTNRFSPPQIYILMLVATGQL
ncbi:TniQ family protein [Vibrio parahaemolyticus]|nr:TniQ family protein [Vibrio parahaemolyticus]